MALCSLIFSSSEETNQPVCRALMDLGIAIESCADLTGAQQKLSSEIVHLLIVDWDQRSEAESLLKAARDRRAAERPLTLAIVSNDASAQQALQSGANSLLRKPLVANQIRDTLSTARDLLRSRDVDSVGKTDTTPDASPVSAFKAILSKAADSENKLRAGELLQGSTAPGAQFEIESDQNKTFEPTAESQVDLLKDLEPMAGSVQASTPEPVPRPAPSESRGLAWYLKNRGIGPAAAAAPAPAPEPIPSEKPELLSYEQTVAAPSPEPAVVAAAAVSPAQPEGGGSEQKAEQELFAYISGEKKPRRQRSTSSYAWVRKVLLFAAFAATCGIAYVKVPRGEWRHNVQLVARGLHNWLYPQVPNPVQAPDTHETFDRAYDDYKLPTAEPIPDATTDPSQIKVVPVVDPTAKKPTTTDADADQDAGANGSSDTPQTPAAQPQDSGNSGTTQPAVAPTPIQQSPAVTPVPVQPAPVSPVASVPAPVVSAPPIVVRPALAKPSPALPMTQPSQTNIPSSLRSQLAPAGPDLGTTKPSDIAGASIEPVPLPEPVARTLLAQQVAPVYPGMGKPGRVVLQVLIGRDGTVQDAKFLQGSFAFAQAAIDAVHNWHFKPYMMNGRAVSVQTSLTIDFKPAS